MPTIPVSENQRELGAFYTQGNPFIFKPFQSWFSQINSKDPILEPFAGTRQIATLMKEAGFTTTWKFYDINPSLEGVETRDSITNFPKGFKTVITNPPYLSRNLAKRKGMKIDENLFKGYQSLYQPSIEAALKSCDYVAMIIPESFITSGCFTERLQSVVSLTFEMFEDTEMPTCLALWGPEKTSDFQVWRNNQLLGNFKELVGLLIPSPCAKRIRFNDPSGNLGLRAIDNTVSDNIFFCLPEDIPIEKVKVSSRLITRVNVKEVQDINTLMIEANQMISDWRKASQDIALTAFKGLRKDGRFRRRLDYANARAILSQAICKTEQHKH